MVNLAQLGELIYNLGCNTGDVSRFQTSARIFRCALAQNSQILPLIGLIKSLIAIGDASSLDELTQRLGATNEPIQGITVSNKADLKFLYAMGLAKQGKSSQAIEIFERWLNLNPKHEEAEWVRCYIASPNDLLLWAYSFGKQTIASTNSLESLQKCYTDVKQLLTLPYAQIHVAFGQAFSQLGNFEQAIEAYKTAIAQLQMVQSSNVRKPEIYLSLAHAQLHYGQYYETVQTLKRYINLVSLEDKLLATTLLNMIERMLNSRKHALLVGINQYDSRALPRLRGAKNDVAAMRDVLIQRWGFLPEDITELVDEAATRDSILTKFKLLTVISRERPCVFYFAGHGSVDENAIPTIVPADSRSRNDMSDISIEDLSRLAGNNASNLIAIFDAGFDNEQGKLASTRAVPKAVVQTIPQLMYGSYAKVNSPTSKKTRFKNHDEWQKTMNGLVVGAISIFAHPPELMHHSRILETKHQTNHAFNAMPTYRGRLTNALVEVLNQSGMSLDVAHLRDAIKRQFADIELPAIKTAKPNDDKRPVLLSATHTDAIATINEIMSQPMRKNAEQIQIGVTQFEKKYGAWAEGRLNVGLAMAEIGQIDDAINWMTRARECFAQNVAMKNGDASGLQYLKADIGAEIDFALGRLLYSASRIDLLDRSILLLESAYQQRPSDARTQYYLGQAMRRQIDLKYAKRVESLLRSYLQQGAPLGESTEINDYLGKLQQMQSHSF